MIKRQVIKYLFVGLLGTLLDFLFLYLLVEYCHLHYVLAAIISISIIIWLTFNLHKYWTFQNREKNYLFQFLKYLLSRGVSHLINFAVLIFLVEIFNLWYLWAKLFAVVIAASINFFLLREFAFRKRQKIILQFPK